MGSSLLGQTPGLVPFSHTFKSLQAQVPWYHQDGSEATSVLYDEQATPLVSDPIIFPEGVCLAHRGAGPPTVTDGGHEV